MWQAGVTLHCGARASHYRGLSCCGAQAPDAQAQSLWLTGMWDLPRPGLEPVSPALAGRFSITAPPGKPLDFSDPFSSQILSFCFIGFLLVFLSWIWPLIDLFSFFNLFPSDSHKQYGIRNKPLGEPHIPSFTPSSFAEAGVLI